ncbi:hypothetical protein ACP4OV_022953 [Aristida adscensionis]
MPSLLFLGPLAATDVKVKERKIERPDPDQRSDRHPTDRVQAGSLRVAARPGAIQAKQERHEARLLRPPAAPDPPATAADHLTPEASTPARRSLLGAARARVVKTRLELGTCGHGAEEDDKEDYGSGRPSTTTTTATKNTVTLRISEDRVKFVDNYLKCQAHFNYWMAWNSKFRVRYGDRILYTTPIEGTFYYVLEYRGQRLVFIIVARNAWLIGFCNDHGYFQLQSKEYKGLYMDSAHTQMLKFDGNHKSVNPGATKNILINMHAVISHFEGLVSYRGPSHHQDSLFLASHVGFFVMMLMEAKCHETCTNICYGLLEDIDRRFGYSWITKAINEWSSISHQILECLDSDNYAPHDCGIEELKLFDDLLSVFSYLHVDGYFGGTFIHEPQDPEPRTLTWDPIDPGVGDGDILVRPEPWPRNTGGIQCHGAHKRVSANDDLSLDGRRKNKPRGLFGGGLGGAPAAPLLFQRWLRTQNNDKKTCDDLERHLNSMGRTVLPVKRKLARCELEQLVKKPKETGALEVIEKGPRTPHLPGEAHIVPKESAASATAVANAATSRPSYCAQKNTQISSSVSLNHIDIDSLRPGEFITDNVISMEFGNLNDDLVGRGVSNIQLVDPAVTFLMCNDPEDKAGSARTLKIKPGQLLLFPLNDNEDVSKANGGKHWSLLVLDLRALHNPRFLHYDSAGGANIQSAHRLINTLRPMLPDDINIIEAGTPQQENLYDCGLYVIAISAAICRWAMFHAEANSVAGEEVDWSPLMWRNVDADTVAKLRISLHKRALGHHPTKSPPD